MPGLAKRCKDDPTFWSPPAHPCPVGGSWPGRFGLPRFYKYCVINKFNLAFRLTAFARGKAWHAWGPNRPGAQALSIFNLSTATDMWLYCCILTPCHKGCPISSRGRRATGMKGSSACWVIFMHLFIFLDSVALAPHSCRKRIKKCTLPTATERQPQQALNIESFYKGLCSMLLPSGSIACASSSNCQARQPCSFLSRKASAHATRTPGIHGISATLLGYPLVN